MRLLILMVMVWIFFWLLMSGCTPYRRMDLAWTPRSCPHPRKLKLPRQPRPKELRIVTVQRVVIDTVKIVQRIVEHQTVVDTVHIEHHQKIEYASEMPKFDLTPRAWQQRDSLHWMFYNARNIPQLRAQANVIRNATQKGVNTKERMADMFLAIIEEIEILQGATIDLRIIKTDPYTWRPLGGPRVGIEKKGLTFEVK